MKRRIKKKFSYRNLLFLFFVDLMDNIDLLSNKSIDDTYNIPNTSSSSSTTTTVTVDNNNIEMSS